MYIYRYIHMYTHIYIYTYTRTFPRNSYDFLENPRKHGTVR